ncbi:hypothetical protein [Arachidicoccus terrestris]|uniref:hypothetical protein n=1 Tax=Arachidicoccus terrestris TaxID=2875539 RepID=UPI001CC37125|nr:hypothetical protein [Arachidicoccus terrestris]UAY54799.1 hypothetical protein K9M52_15325 [Arachidicoccus terrestris]
MNYFDFKQKVFYEYFDPKQVLLFYYRDNKTGKTHRYNCGLCGGSFGAALNKMEDFRGDIYFSLKSGRFTMLRYRLISYFDSKKLPDY